MTPVIDDTPITSDSTVRRNPDQISEDLDGETALMSIETGKYYCLNETSSRIYNLLEEPLRVCDLCEKLTEEFEIGLEQCQADVINHLEELRKECVVEKVRVSLE